MTVQRHGVRGVALSILSPLWGFVGAVAALMGMVILGVEVAASIVISTLLFGILSADPNSFVTSIVEGLIGASTLNLFATLALALFLTSLLRTTGVLEKTTRLFQAIGCRFASLAVPAVVGLIPMPGGALVSAMMLKDMYMEKLKLDRVYASFLNYWFRHVWVPTWPLYQAIILASAILDTSVSTIVSATFVASVGSIGAGLLLAYRRLRGVDVSNCRRSGISPRLLVEGTWPYVLIAVLVFGLKLDIKVVLLIVLTILLIVKRPGLNDYVEGLKFALSPRIVTIIFSVMIFRELVSSTGAALDLYEMLEHHGIPKLLIAFLIPFSIGVATSGEFIYAAIAFPILSGITGVGASVRSLPLLVAFTAGYLGVMLSPVHLCVVLTSDHYETSVSKVYRYTLPAVATSFLITYTLGILLFG